MTEGQDNPLDIARSIFALSRTGLHFAGPQYRSDAASSFDRERYDAIGQLAAKLIAQLTDAPVAELLKAWRDDDGYVTPKIDVRGAIFQNDRVLLVRERSDGKWTLPGGWADVNDTPREAVEKEIVQESGYSATAVKLAGVYDRRKRNYPHSVFHIWKLFFVCEITGGSPRLSDETDGVEFFPLNALPELSTGRTIAEQIRSTYLHACDKSLPTDFD